MMGTSLRKSYRGFTLQATRERGTHVTWPLRNCCFWIPRSFTWFDGEEPLHQYLDAILAKDTVAQQQYLDAGVARDHVYDSHNPARERPLITLSPSLLLSVLRGEFPLEVPDDGVIVLRALEGRLMPTKFLAELASEGLMDAYNEALEAKIQNGEPVRVQVVDPVDAEGAALPPLVWAGRYASPAANLRLAAEQGQSTPPLPVTERTLSTVPLVGGAMEVITLCEQQERGGHTRSYFVRRILSAQGTPLYTGTAWSLKGPWVASHRNDAEMRLLGIVA